MANIIKAFCTWTCGRCGCKDSTSVPVYAQDRRIGMEVYPGGWTRLAKLDLCGECSGKVREVLIGGH